MRVLFVFLLLFLSLFVFGQDQVRKISSKFSRFGGDVSVSVNRFLYYDPETYSMKKGVNLAPCLRLRYSVRYTSFTVGVLYNINKNARDIAYVSDYTYSFVRSKYVANSFAYGYLNYDQNKYSNSLLQVKDAFLRGMYFVKYYFKIPAKIEKFTSFDSTGVLRPSLQLGYSFKYCDTTGKSIGGVFSGKPVLMADLQYVFYRNMYLYFAVNFYLKSETKQPWDSDFYYGFGLNRYAPYTFRFGYGNYYGNKFPGNKQKQPITDFFNGVFSVSFNFSF